MNYKNIIKCLFVAGTLSVSTSSCSDWLEVDMEDSILETTLFSTNEGFLTALNGVYSSLNNSSLYGGTLGIVTMEDVLEELVGEIYDERDEVVTEFTEVTPDTYEISGDMPVDDFLDEIDYHPADIEEDDYDTMNGLALSVLEHIPAVGETFQLGRLTFTVLEMEEQKIEKMRVILAPDSEKEAEKEKEKD